MNSSHDLAPFRSFFERGRPNPRTAALLLALGAACSDSDPVQLAPPGAPSDPPNVSPTQRGPFEGTATGQDVSDAPPSDEPGGASPVAPDPTLADAGPSARGSRPLDLLFVIDNSISMADKQQLLRQVANVLDRFAHPACVDAAGNQYPSPPPGEACAAGQRLQFEPVSDVHLGVITTSLGDGGANVACPVEGLPRFVPERIDRAHLLGTLPRGSAAGADAQGFVSWKAGEDEALATERFGNLLTAAGEGGCGWEMPLEAWYRFLVDPYPYAELTRVLCPGSTSGRLDCVQPATAPDGALLLDQPLLAQREAFLRPHSSLGIVMLTDENDCSLAIGDQNWAVLAIDDSRPFFRGASVCQENPNDPCCYSCPLGPPEGCAADPICAGDAGSGTSPDRLPAAADGQNLRCFDQKRRFGADFLYPVQRYINALTEPELCPLEDDLSAQDCGAARVPNPLFAEGRRASDVFVAGIVGVPRQLVEARQNVPGRPALENGFRYKLGSELSLADWAALVGDSSASPPVPPTSPFMLESALPRAGVPAANEVNGREYDSVGPFAEGPDDLQYACIFPLPEPRDCNGLDPFTQACDCYEGDRDRALCEQSPGVSEAGSVQYWGKAYPSTRQLELMRGLGERAVVTSICAHNTTNPDAADFSYRPALAALADGMEAARSQP